MALNIEDPAVHQAVKKIVTMTGESQAQAVAIAVNERLARLESADLAADLMELGSRTARRMSPTTRALDHGALLYDAQGLPT